MKKIVLDCSVIVKWFFSQNEKRVKQAKILRNSLIKDKINVFLPSLFFFEFINVIIIAKKIPYQLAMVIIDKLLKLNFIFVNNDADYIKKVIYYTNKYKISAYDAAYITLAKEKGAILITEDKKLIKQTKLSFIKSLEGVKI